MPTAAQEWVQQGRAEGLAEGMAAGRMEGRQEGRIDVLLRQMRRRFEEVPTAVEARVRTANAAQLDRWSEAILDAPSLDALLTGGSAH